MFLPSNGGRLSLAGGERMGERGEGASAFWFSSAASWDRWNCRGGLEAMDGYPLDFPVDKVLL